jgi:hypothetical protein
MKILQKYKIHCFSERLEIFSLLVILLLALCRADISAEVLVKEDPHGSGYTFFDGEVPLLTYNAGEVPVPNGIGGKYAIARSGYIHPIYGFNGEELTADFPSDHPHHRGVYWAWPEVGYRGKTNDLHALQGVQSKPADLVQYACEAGSAWIKHENIWIWEEGEEIVKEIVVIKAHRPETGLRTFDLHLTFEALVPGVEIARRDMKSYGGLNVRMSPRSKQNILKKLDLNDSDSIAWAELIGVPEGGDGKVGVLILQSPLNPQHPCEWVAYPKINWLQPTFPRSGERFRLSQDKPLELRYRIVVRSGAGLDKPVQSIVESYNNGR